MMKEAVGVISQPILRQHHILQNELAAGTHPTTLSLDVLFFSVGQISRTAASNRDLSCDTAPWKMEEAGGVDA